MQELLGKVQNVRTRVKEQLDKIAKKAYEDNRRNYEEQKVRLKDLFADMHNFVDKLNENITRTVRKYVQVHTAPTTSCVKGKGTMHI